MESIDTISPFNRTINTFGAPNKGIFISDRIPLDDLDITDDALLGMSMLLLLLILLVCCPPRSGEVLEFLEMPDI